MAPLPAVSNLTSSFLRSQPKAWLMKLASVLASLALVSRVWPEMWAAIDGWPVPRRRGLADHERHALVDGRGHALGVPGEAGVGDGPAERALDVGLADFAAIVEGDEANLGHIEGPFP